ncbi:MAG: extracellular solute-binding protein [Clostridia bacterium]|nr:extracellular solute-binding protein [Clostridia bacterium]
MKRFFAILLAMLLVSVSFVALAEEPTTISAVAVLSSHTDDLETLPYYQEIAEATNMNIEWEYVRTGWDEKKPLVLASGDLPDVFFGCYALKVSDITQNIDYFLPLNDLIEENCPNIKRMFEDVPGLADLVTWPDGNIYALPHVMPLRPSHFGAAFINKTWLDNLNLEMPTTIDEFTDVMRHFKNDDPNGNGEADEIPMYAYVYNNNFGFRTLMGSFGITDSIDSDLAYDNDGNMVYVPATENYKNYISWMHDLYSEGLIYSDFLTMDWSSYMGAMGLGGDCKYGFACGWTPAHISSEYRDQFVQMLPLIGPDGSQEWASNYLMVACGASGYNVVSLTTFNEYPAETMKWLDKFYEDEYGMQNYFGPMDLCIEKKDDGTYQLLEPADPAYDPDSWLWKNGMGDEGPYYVSQSTQELILPNTWAKTKLELDKGYQPYFNPNRAVPAVILEPMDNDIVSEILTDVERIVTERRAHWVVDGGIEDEWDEYIASLEEVGLQEYLEIERNAVARVSD